MIIEQALNLFKERLHTKNAVFLFIGTFLVAGCSGTKEVSQNFTEEVNYSIISVIHADANYLYHENGEVLLANEEALNQSVEIAENAEKGEVFIFHQKPERKAFLFFPKKDRELYHYRNGKLVQKIKYSPTGGGLGKESELYKKYSAKNNERNYFVYFGHEIPTYLNRSYHHSMPDQEFSTEIFSNDLKKLSQKFELSILSTCNNGNPYMLNELTDVSKRVIASPQNLHLSYLNIGALKMLESKSNVTADDLVNSIASTSYQILSEKLQTVVTVGVYDLEELKGNEDFRGLTQSYRNYIEGRKPGDFFADNSDCSDLDGLTTLPEKGVKIYYKPPAFGRKSTKKTHSGWGCKE